MYMYSTPSLTLACSRLVLSVSVSLRKPGLLAMINQMSSQMDKGHYLFEYSDYGQDIHTAASLLKKFFKELPDPLIPDNMYAHFLACARLADEKVRLTTLKELVYRLPTAHYHTLRFLIRHLVVVSTHHVQNKVWNREGGGRGMGERGRREERQCVG